MAGEGRREYKGDRRGASIGTDEQHKGGDANACLLPPAA